MLVPILILAVTTLVDPLPVPVDSLMVPPMSPVSADSVRLPAAAPRAPRAEVRLGEVYTGWKVTGVRIEGVPGDVASELNRGLSLSGQSRWLVFRRRPPFAPAILADDLDRSRLFLVRNGYPSAVVAPVFETNAEKRELRLRFEIQSGPRLLVAANRTEAVPPALQGKATKLLQLDRNEPFRDSRVEQRIARLLTLLQEDGRAKAKVTTQMTPIDSTHIEILFKVDAGPVYHFVGQRVDGAAPNLMSTVTRTIDIDAGETYAPSKLHRAEDGLRALDLFRRVEVTTTDAGDDGLEVVGHLAERAPRTLQTGVGFFTDDQAELSAQWKHRNLFGGGRGASVDASYSRFLQRAGISFWKPVLFHSRTRGSLTFDVRRESEALYTLRTTEVEAAATYLESARTTIRPAVTVSRIAIDTDLPIDSVFDAPPTSLVTAGIRWTHSALDDAIDPSRGTYAWASVEYGLPNFKFENQYALTETEGIAYRPLTDRTLLAGRAHLGLAIPVGNSLGLLPNKRFYGGGASSMRGYRRRQLGPLDSEFRPIGGVGLFESSLEYRFPLIGELQGATFVDAAQVWERRSDFFTQLAVASGPGVIVRTPIGLARLDVGFLLTDPEPHQPRTVLQIQVGHGF